MNGSSMLVFLLEYCEGCCKSEILQLHLINGRCPIKYNIRNVQYILDELKILIRNS